MNDAPLEPWDAEISTAPVARKVLEKDIQKACVAYARSRGWWARKFASPANRSVPDYIFGKNGCVVFIEFKAPGKKPTENQLEEHKAMVAAGLTVYWLDNVDLFKTVMRVIERSWTTAT